VDLLIPGIFIVAGFVLLLIDLILFEKKSIGQTLITLQFGVPKKPLGIIANAVVIISAIALVLAYLRII